MSVIKKLKEVSLRIVLPMVVAGSVTIVFFVSGFRAGAERQLQSDEPLLQQCVTEIQDARERTELKESKACNTFCEVVYTASGAPMPPIKSLRSPSGACACFFEVNIDE